MNKQAEIRIDELVYKSLEGMIAEEECRELETILDSDPDATEYYISSIEFNNRILKIKDSINKPLQIMMAFEELAEYEKTAPEIELSSAKAQPELIQKVVYAPTEKRIITKFQIVTIMMSAAAILFFVLFLQFAPEKRYAMEVATFVDQINVKWADSKTDFKNGDRLWTNQLPIGLDKGAVKIQYDDGVDVLIEGPAKFTVERSRVYLEYGRLFSHVSESGLGFSVETPTSRFVDMGTKFGIQADINGSTELHVIKGKVQYFAGSDGNTKTSQLLTENKAIRYDVNTGKTKTVPIRTEAFVRSFNSVSGILWRGQKSLNLADIVGGGNGFNTGRINTGVETATGKMVADLPTGTVKVATTGYKSVDSSRFIDGVFVPGLEDGVTPITADHSITARFPKTSGNYWGYVCNGAFHEGDEVPRHPLQLNGVPFGNPENPSIAIHSNQGITFDLLSIRKNIPDMNIEKFRSLIGISETVKTYASEAKVGDAESLSKGIISTVDFWIYLDGRKVYEFEMSDSDKPEQVEIPIGTQDRYLTLVVTEAGQGWAFDWALFGRPELVISPTK